MTTIIPQNRLSFADVALLISEIVIGGRVVNIKNDSGACETLMFRMPTHRDRLEIDLAVKNVLREAIDYGIPTRQEMEQIVKEQKMIDEERIAEEETELDDQLKTFEVKLKVTRSPQQMNWLKKKIDNIRLRKAVLEQKRRAPFLNTAEAKAEQHRTLLLVVRGVYRSNGEHYWNTVHDFLDDENHNVQGPLIREYLRYVEGIPPRMIRQIARDPQWLIYWRAAKHSGTQVFEGAATSWDINKANLVYWTQFYDDIVSSPDAPPARILEDDYQLDIWVDERRKMRKAEQHVTYEDKAGKGTTTYHVNEPYRVVTREELERLKKPDAQ